MRADADGGEVELPVDGFDGLIITLKKSEEKCELRNTYIDSLGC